MKVGVIMGSTSDWEVMAAAADITSQSLVDPIITPTFILSV